MCVTCTCNLTEWNVDETPNMLECTLSRQLQLVGQSVSDYSSPHHHQWTTTTKYGRDVFGMSFYSIQYRSQAAVFAAGSKLSDGVLSS